MLSARVLVCWAAAGVLAGLSARAARGAEDVGRLLRDLRSGSGRRFVAMRRIDELGPEQIRNNRVVYVLLKELGSDRNCNVTVRLRAIELAALLVATKDSGAKKEAVGIIARILKSPSQRSEVRSACAKALGGLCSPEDEEDASALALLGSVICGGRESARLRLAAVRALGRIVQRGPVERAAGRRGVATLVGAVGDDDEAVSSEARRALKVLSGRDFGADVAAWRGWHDEASRALAKSGGGGEAESR